MTDAGATARGPDAPVVAIDGPAASGKGTIAWSVAQAHRLSEEIEERIRSLVPNASIFTHIEPISDPSSYEDQGLDR